MATKKATKDDEAPTISSGHIEPKGDEEEVVSGPPAAIHPQSTPDQAADRVAWENNVNAGAEQFAADAHAAYITAAVNGQTVSLVTSDAE